MKIQISKRFSKDTQKITDKRILAKIKQVIIEASQAESLVNISDLEEMSGFPKFYFVNLDTFRSRIRYIGESGRNGCCPNQTCLDKLSS